MGIDKIISNLESLDLAQNPYDEVLSLLKCANNIGFIVTTYSKGKSLIRARPNENDIQFRFKKDLSYKPKEKNLCYQRASTPNNTMFYACCLPEMLEHGELCNERVIATFESMPWIRNELCSGNKKITFGKWIVKEDINLIAIVHKKDFFMASRYIRELVTTFDDFLNNYSLDVQERAFMFLSFLAEEFSKEINVHTDYMISAIFSELITKIRNIDGIFYPSLRVSGQGFNVAIKPESCYKLCLTDVMESTIYKIKDKVIVDNDFIAHLENNSDEFFLSKIPNNKDKVLKEFGFNSIEEFNI